MDLGLRGKRALVMGASSGLGRAVAETLVQEGARVAICSRDEGRIRATAKDIGAAEAIAADTTREGETRRVVEKAIDVLGGLDVFVHNTGGPPKGSITELTREQWLEGFQSLWMSAIEGINAALPGMRKERFGRIVLVTSAAAREAMPLLTVSNGLRAGLLGLTKSISNEVSGEGVTVNAVLPGFHATERLKELNIPEEKITTQIPARRLGKPEELGALVAFLASVPAAYITGQAITIDGGWSRSI